MYITGKICLNIITRSCIENNKQIKAKRVYLYNHMLHVNMGPRIKKTLTIFCVTKEMNIYGHVLKIIIK